MAEIGIVYILTNPLFTENIIKIGSTKDIQTRIKTLSRETGVPCPFECYVAYSVKDYKKIENIMHKIYKGVNKHTDKKHTKKEFFCVEPNVADDVLSSIVELIGGEKIQVDNSGIYTKAQQEQLADKEKIQIAKKFKFANYQIPIGSELVFTKDSKTKCIVSSNNKVTYKNKEYSLSGLTKELMKKLNYSSTQYNGYAYWTFEDTILTELSKKIKGN